MGLHSRYASSLINFDLRSPSWCQYEIRANPTIVDLLVSLAYIATAEDAPDSPLPVGMGLRVKGKATFGVPLGPDGLCEFDKLPPNEVRLSLFAVTPFLTE